MKLSEAIDLGRMLLPEDKWDGGSFCGCALAMGALSVGLQAGKPSKPDDLAASMESLAFIKSEWPWLDIEFEIPDGLWMKRVFKKASATLIISYLFSAVVHNNGVTMDQLIDWVRANEPREEVTNGNGNVEQVASTARSAS